MAQTVAYLLVVTQGLDIDFNVKASVYG